MAKIGLGGREKNACKREGESKRCGGTVEKRD